MTDALLTRQQVEPGTRSLGRRPPEGQRQGGLMNASGRTKFVKLRIPTALFERLHAALGYRSRQQTENYCLTLLVDRAKGLERDKRAELGDAFGKAWVRKQDGTTRPAQGT